MKLSSEAFKHNGTIPIKYTCQGEDINPPFTIDDIPSGTKTLALIMDDPDVPAHIRKDKMWVHWVIFNMSPETRIIKEGVSPPGIYGQNTDRENAYMGPCPPDREHRYFFKLYALDITLPLPAGATKEHLLVAMEGHILAQCELIGRYEKS